MLFARSALPAWIKIERWEKAERRLRKWPPVAEMVVGRERSKFNKDALAYSFSLVHLKSGAEYSVHVFLDAGLNCSRRGPQPSRFISRVQE